MKKVYFSTLNSFCSCLLFFLVASESSKYSSESIVEPFDPKSVGTVNNLDDLQRTIEQIFNEEEINQAYSTTVTPDTDLPFTIFEPTTTSTPDVSINLVLSDVKDKDEKRTFLYVSNIITLKHGLLTVDNILDYLM